MRRRCRFLTVVLLPLLLSAADPPQNSIEVYFPPGGGCTDATVREIGGATKTLRIQAYSFTSTPISELRGRQEDQARESREVQERP